MGHIARVLNEWKPEGMLFPTGVSRSTDTSSVLLLLGSHCGAEGDKGETCVVLNKRSSRVKQPGDLCFPGGSMSPRLDIFLAGILSLPGFPLARWPYWKHWIRVRPREARRLSFLLATALREGVEEIRLNPLGVKFLGPLPAQKLSLFQRVIYPMAAWITAQKRFFPNWEVESMVFIPLRNLLNPELYTCYRLRFDTGETNPRSAVPEIRDMPGFVHERPEGTEILWGATYYIVTIFLECVFGFRPPALASRPVINGTLGPDYLGGRPRRDTPEL